MIRVLAIVGTRPQYIKHAAMEMSAHQYSDKIEFDWIDTGQHYDPEMSDFFKQDFGLSQPIRSLSFNHDSNQALELLKRQLISEMENINPDIVIVYGDTSSTLAAAKATKNLNKPLAHVEAGLRSYNQDMPEEINRVATDHISDLLFVPNQSAKSNLAKEGLLSNVFETGDVMFDLINRFTDEQINSPIEKPYYYLSLHRPYNVDNPTRLAYVLQSINDLGVSIICPLHPRTRQRLKESKLNVTEFHHVDFVQPFSYIENLRHLQFAKRILTDSGGLQKEAYWLKVPCITLRSETEWHETLTGDWNQLIFTDLSTLKSKIEIKPDLDLYQEALYSKGSAANIIFEQILQYMNRV